MRLLFITSVLVGLVSAQVFDLGLITPPTIVTAPVDVVSQSATYSPTPTLTVTPNPAVRRRRIEKRDGDCAAQPLGSGEVPSPDTDTAFLADQDLQNLAVYATTPDDYTKEFDNLAGSVSASLYMGLDTLDAYDTITCASLCDQASGCVAFNIYIERDPTLDPNAENCPNPPSTTNFKCTLWGVPITAAEATNIGQWRDSFHVVIIGSNGYNKDAPPPSIPGFIGPQELGGAINAPGNTLTASKFFQFSQNQGYSPTTCANACLLSNLGTPAGSPLSCVFFDAFVVSLNGVPQGMMCAYYSQVWAPSYATNYGQTDSEGNRFSFSESYSYSLIINPNLIQDPNFTQGTSQDPLGPWYATIFPIGAFFPDSSCFQGLGCASGTFVPGLTAITITQGPITLTVGQEYSLSYSYIVSLGGPSPNSGFCDLGAGIDAGEAAPTIPQGESASGVASTTFVAQSGSPQNFTIDMTCVDNDYSNIYVTSFILTAI